MMTAVTTIETLHGNPGEHLSLPAGTLVHVHPADNQPADSPVKYWVTPVDPSTVTIALLNWADGPGIGVGDAVLAGFRTNLNPRSTPTPIHDDGYADGGEPYTDAEIAAMDLLKN